MTLLTYTQAANYTGLSVRVLRRAASRTTPFKKRLPVVRVGHRTVRLKEADLESWIERQRR